MFNKKEINWEKVQGCTYDTEKYLKDIPLITLVSYFVKLSSDDGECYFGEFELNNKKNVVRINKKLNIGYLNNELMNPETFVELFIGKDEDPVPVILKITGIDLDDYINEVWY